jgi:hypothetical protein
LLDTENEEHIRQYLENYEDAGLPSKDELGAPAKQVLDQVLKLIGPGSPLLGIVVSKFDHVHTLRAFQDLDGSNTLIRAVRNLGAAFNRDPMPDAYPTQVNDQFIFPNPNDITLLNLELQSLLHQFGADDLLIKVGSKRPDLAADISLFAVSCLGEPVKGKSVSVRGITPFRVLDPILWLLVNSWAK